MKRLIIILFICVSSASCNWEDYEWELDPFGSPVPVIEREEEVIKTPKLVCNENNYCKIEYK